MPTKFCLVKTMIFPEGMGGCDRWIIKEAEHQRIDAFELWCWRRFLRIPWTARRSNQSIVKELNPEYSLEGLLLKQKLQYFGYLMWRAASFEKTLMIHVDIWWNQYNIVKLKNKIKRERERNRERERDKESKDPDIGKDSKWEEKERTEDETVGWHHRLKGHEFEESRAVGDRQGDLICCSPWGSQRVRHDWATELNWTKACSQFSKLNFNST